MSDWRWALSKELKFHSARTHLTPRTSHPTPRIPHLVLKYKPHPFFGQKVPLPE
ncbi:hypothetical protein [Petrimonas sp.]|uniref:hypothetical protein n=1 Tax=Petrimonas sp. TaxID=2023866 RepID=UPI003F50FEEE